MAPRLYALCAFAIIVALVVVGAVSDGVVRHIIQTAPLWIVVVLGLRNAPATKWAALPMAIVWLIIMALIWLFLLGLANIVTGRFSPVEIAMTVVVGAASLAAIVGFWPGRSGASLAARTTGLLAGAALQVAAVALSLQDPFYSDTALAAWMSAS